MSRPRVELHLGDCLEVLKGLPDGSVDAVVTDPPYSSGGAFRSDRSQPAKAKAEGNGYKTGPRSLLCGDFSGDNKDQRSFVLWAYLWLSESLRATVPGGACCVFADWRQVPVVTDAIQAAGWVWRGLAPWDKTGAARPQRGRFRNQCEYVVWGTNGPGPTDGPCLPGLHRQSVLSESKEHVTAKTVGVMEWAISICRPGGVVLDPFMGSGTTGVACMRTGRDFIGVERESSYHAVARRRIDAELDKLALLEPEPIPR